MVISGGGGGRYWFRTVRSKANELQAPRTTMGGGGTRRKQHLLAADVRDAVDDVIILVTGVPPVIEAAVKLLFPDTDAHRWIPPSGTDGRHLVAGFAC